MIPLTVVALAVTVAARAQPVEIVIVLGSLVDLAVPPARSEGGNHPLVLVPTQISARLVGLKRGEKQIDAWNQIGRSKLFRRTSILQSTILRPKPQTEQLRVINALSIWMKFQRYQSTDSYSEYRSDLETLVCMVPLLMRRQLDPSRSI